MKLALPIDVPPTHAWDFAIWATTLAEIEERGYTFACDADDLDSFNYAEVHDPEIGKIFLLQRHHPPICLGVDVMVQADTPTKDALAAMERIFGCREEDYSWITPYSRYPGPGGEFLDEPVEEASLANARRRTENWIERHLPAELEHFRELTEIR